jgi:hypothetical protein
LSTFELTNHLLACSRCNSHAKRSLFPRDEYGNPLIIDPTTEDPWEHMRLTPSTGEYVAMTPKRQTAIDLLFDTDLLARGRRAAWLDATDLIIGHHKAVLSGNFQFIARQSGDAPPSVRDRPRDDQQSIAPPG